MRNKKGEIGTIVMMVLLVLGSVIAFSSSNFIAKNKTTSTKAATTCPAGILQNCGSGNRYCCDRDEGYDSSKVGSNLEFACCVADQHQEDDTYRIGWYGYTGQPCSNTKIGGTYLGHLVGCVGGQEALSSQEGGRGRYSLSGNAVVFSPTTVPTVQPPDPTCVRPTISSTAGHGGGLICPTGMPLNRDTSWCCPVTLIPSEAPTPSISCRLQQATCSDGSTKFDYYKLISSDCTGSNLDKLCYGTEEGKCDLYNWANIWKNKCNNTTLPTAVPTVATGTTPEVGTPAAIETSTPIPPTPILTPNVCQQIGCSSIDPLDSDITDLWIKTTGVQKNYYKSLSFCDRNEQAISDVLQYCKKQPRDLTISIQLDIISQLTDARPNSPYFLDVITPRIDNTNYILAEEIITNSNLLKLSTLNFKRERYDKYNVMFCYETNEKESAGSESLDKTIYKRNCFYSNENYQSYSYVANNATFTINIGE